MRPLLFAALISPLIAPLLAASPALAAPAFDIPSGRYIGDPTHSSVTFKISHFGLSFYTARFAAVESAVVLDAADPSRSSVSVMIDTNSVRTDFPFPAREDFDKKVGDGADFLNGAAFPKISFVSKAITPTGARTAQISGDLTLRGVTKPVTLAAVLNGTLVNHPFRKVPMFGISATTTINRGDFGMSFGKGVLGDEVTIIIEAEFAKAPAP
jgi:polyisoprenoid-binding protein YceI